MTGRVECVVVGAGVVGLATARALALEGHEVVVLEAEKAFGTHTSSRNSEVVHAGIYYPTDSLKARTCVAGRHLLYDYCQERGIDFQKPGKLIVATTASQIEQLKAYRVQGRLNGVDDLELISGKGLAHLEPQVSGLAALWSPSTGIVDSHGLMISLLGNLENAGGTLVLQTRVRRFRRVSQGFELDVEAQGEQMTFQCRMLVNAAGHGAIPLAKASAMENLPDNFFPAGHYYSYQGKSPFSHLVYPVADAGSLGLHATLDLAGQLKFGPDISWRKQLDYGFDSDGDRLRHFESRIRDYYPALDVERLQPGYVGVRPRVSGPSEAAADFIIAGPQDHGVKGFVQLLGIESPGLTACMAIADEVVARMREN